MADSDTDTDPGPGYEDAAGSLRALAARGSERASFHQLHVAIAAEKPNPIRTLWSMLRCLAKASNDDLQKFTELYASVAGPAGSKQRHTRAKTARGPKLSGEDGRLAKPGVQDDFHDKAPRYCDVCKIWLNGKSQNEDHLGGNRHKKNLSAAETLAAGLPLDGKKKCLQQRPPKPSQRVDSAGCPGSTRWSTSSGPAAAPACLAPQLADPRLMLRPAGQRLCPLLQSTDLPAC